MTSLEERPSKGSEKLKMLDITRDKPVKVSVKVAVPVRDHPKFNFVGKLLGPKGNSMKRLQEETMCKMAVLGRGSMRDRKKEEELRASGDTRYAHLFEDLHVEISTFAAPAEAHARIAYALAEVRRFLVPDYHDDIRQEQMWEMQALTSTPQSTAADDSSPNRSSDMDISNDEKPLNDSNCMDCTTDKNETHLSNSSSNDYHQQQTHKLHHLMQHQPKSSGSALSTQVTESISKLHPSAMAVALQHQLSGGIGGILKQTNTVGAVRGLTPNQPNTGITIPNEADGAPNTLTLLESPATILHPALRGVKAINIGNGLGRKRPLLGVPRSGMNPTKRTVMTLLARAKNAQALHAIRNPMATPNSTGFTDPFQMLTSPFLLTHQPPLDQTILTLSKESLAQGV